MAEWSRRTGRARGGEPPGHAIGDELVGDLPDDLRARIKAEMVPGERLLWASRANRRKGGPSRLVLAIWAAGCILASGLAFEGMSGAFGPGLMAAEGLLAVVAAIGGLVGLALVVGLLASLASGGLARTRDARKLYALTDRRAIVWNPMPNSKAVQVHTFARGAVKSVHRVEYPDGSGDVTFGFSEESYWSPVGFEAVSDVRRVEGLVRRTLIDPEPTVG